MSPQHAYMIDLALAEPVRPRLVRVAPRPPEPDIVRPIVPRERALVVHRPQLPARVLWGRELERIPWRRARWDLFSGLALVGLVAVLAVLGEMGVLL